MFDEYSAGLVIVLGLVLAAEFINGCTDATNAIATVVSTRVLSPQTAIAMATLLNTAGAMLGTAVASTIGKGIVESEAINLVTIGAAMVGIVVWSTIAWYYRLPTSESHALVSGLAGAAVATAGLGVLIADGWNKILAGLVFSTVGGWRILKTMGMRMVKLDPHQGFAAETGAGACIALASLLGIPLSTTHTIGGIP